MASGHHVYPRIRVCGEEADEKAAGLGGMPLSFFLAMTKSKGGIEGVQWVGMRWALFQPHRESDWG